MAIVDITSWKLDDHSGTFPVGARDKQMVWSPENVQQNLKPSWPYLFKESIYRYPDQYWTEVIAYIIGKHIGIDVPRALPAQKETENGVISGSLLEWFYDPNTERFMHAGVYFKRLILDFEDKSGKHHNFKDLILLCNLFTKNKVLDPKFIYWIADMMLFDTLIGNTDRHQENWGFVYNDGKFTMSPLFDNGTSLGHERFIEHIKNWDENQIMAYIKKGNHHLRYTRYDTKTRIKHFDFLNCLQLHKLDVKEHMIDKIEQLDETAMLSEIKNLTIINADIKFTKERYNWIQKLLKARIELIKEELK